MAIAIIGCMDRRLNGFFEEIRDNIVKENPDKDVYIIRDAGGGIGVVGKSLFALDVTEIHDYTHTNCGAMKFAMSALEKIRSGGSLDEFESSSDIYDNNIRPFLEEDYGTALAIEQKNKEVQDLTLKSLKITHPGLKSTCELVDINKLNISKEDGEHTLVIGMAYKGKYSYIAKRYNLDMLQTYFVQANYIDEIRPSVRLAVEKLNIHNVIFISNDRSEDNIMEDWSNDPILRRMFDKYLINPPIER